MMPEPETLEEALSVIRTTRRKNAELLGEIKRMKIQRNDARARVLELENKGLAKRIMRRLGWIKASPASI